jgi:hypothetical protein
MDEERSYHPETLAAQALGWVDEETKIPTTSTATAAPTRGRGIRASSSRRRCSRGSKAVPRR